MQSWQRKRSLEVHGRVQRCMCACLCVLTRLSHVHQEPFQLARDQPAKVSQNQAQILRVLRQTDRSLGALDLPLLNKTATETAVSGCHRVLDLALPLFTEHFHHLNTIQSFYYIRIKPNSSTSSGLLSFQSVAAND